MKELDELIEKVRTNGAIGVMERLPIIKDLESLKQSIKEQHKNELFKMYVRPFTNKDGLIEQDMLDILFDRFEQYYNDNF